MTDYSKVIDLGGNDVIVNNLLVGATGPGQAGTSISPTEIGFIDGVTAGTAAASKALVLNSSSAITSGLTALTVTTITPTTIAGTPSFSGVATFAANPTFAAGKTLDLDSATATLVSNAATLTKYAAVVTTEALITAAGASQALVLTLTGLVAAGDLVFVQRAGGTNTRRSFTLDAVATTNTVTVTLYNTEPTNAINGTVIFNIWILKA